PEPQHETTGSPLFGGDHARRQDGRRAIEHRHDARAKPNAPGRHAEGRGQRERILKALAIREPQIIESGWLRPHTTRDTGFEPRRRAEHQAYALRTRHPRRREPCRRRPLLSFDVTPHLPSAAETPGALNVRRSSQPSVAPLAPYIPRGDLVLP